MPELHFPWLECSVLIPLLGAISVGLMRDRDQARRVSIVVCLLAMICTLGEWYDFNSLHTFETHDHWDVLRLIFQRDVFVVDELSAPLLPLAGLLYLLTVGTTNRTKVNRFSFGWTLTSEAILLATLSCREPSTLVVLLSLATIPPWIELRHRRRPTRVYTLHMGLFVVLLASGVWLTTAGDASAANPSIAGVGLLAIAALVRSGVIPLHCWITDLFENVTFGTALLFVTPMTGAYAVIRLVLPIAPHWALQGIAVLSLVTAVYAAGMALVQHETRRFFCYLFLSHSSLVLVGLETVTAIGLTGALCVWLSVGMSLLGFGLTLRGVEARAGRLSLESYHGLIEHTPLLAALFLLTGLSSIGFPGTVGFVGTELLVEGAVGVYPLVGLAVVLAAMLNGIAILQVYFRVFTGTRRGATISLSARPSERFGGLVLIILIVAGGLFPQPGVSSRYHAAVELMNHRKTAVAPHNGQNEKETALDVIDDRLHKPNSDTLQQTPPHAQRGSLDTRTAALIEGIERVTKAKLQLGLFP